MDVVRSAMRRLIHAKTTFRVIAEAADGREALELLKTIQPDVVVTDVNMPHMNGIALTREIKRLYRWIHVLVLTSLPDEATRQAVRDAGASGLIVKGDDLDHLTYALDIASAIGPDRRRGGRPRAITSIWDAPSALPS